MGEWFSIEVGNGPGSALTWHEAYGDLLVGVAVSHGALEWSWEKHPWGFVFEVEFPDDASWEGFCAFPAVSAALDAVPDPVDGLFLHRGRGGSSGARWPRRPLPLAGSGAAALPVPEETHHDDDPAPAVLAPSGGEPRGWEWLPASA